MRCLIIFCFEGCWDKASDEWSLERRTVSLTYIKFFRTDDELRYYSTLSHCQVSLEKLSVVCRSDWSTYLRHYIFSSYSFQAGVCGFFGDSVLGCCDQVTVIDTPKVISYDCVNKVFHFRYVTKPSAIKFSSEVASLCGLSSFIF